MKTIFIALLLFASSFKSYAYENFDPSYTGEMWIVINFTDFPAGTPERWKHPYIIAKEGRECSEYFVRYVLLTRGKTNYESFKCYDADKCRFIPPYCGEEALKDAWYMNNIQVNYKKYCMYALIYEDFSFGQYGLTQEQAIKSCS